MTALTFASTFSKSPLMYGLPPDLCVIGADGCTLVLSDGTTVTDWVSGLGTNLLGYNAMPAPKARYAPSLPHYLEAETADKLALLLGRHVPGWTPEGLGVRWCKTGSEATTMAVRLARAVTRRNWVLTFDGHYHGWGDTFIARTEPAWGLPVRIISHEKKYRMDSVRVLESSAWNSPDAFERFINYDFAAVIFEQPATDPDPEWYPFLRRWCSDNGALLIADETVTGLRYGLGGACERYGIEPDLLCMGKALGNGVPINALVGRREYLDWFAREDPVFCSSTFWGETGGLAAADWVLDKWTQEKVDYIWMIGERLIAGLVEAGWDVFGHGARSVLRFGSDVERAWFIQGMYKRGFLMNRPNFPTTMHSLADVAKTITAAKEVRQEWDRVGPEAAAVLMADKMPRVLFRNR